MLDLSLTGARICLLSQHSAEGALVNGADAVLEWESGEAFGEIVWTEGEVFGLEFDEILDPKVLIATRDVHDQLARLGGLPYLDDQIARKWYDDDRE